jgi:CHAT domain-containing protein
LNIESGNYLADEQQIYLLTNVTDLPTSIMSNNFDKKNCILVACPMYNLPAARNEISQIDSILQRNSYTTQTYIDSTANEKKIKCLKNPILLHFATHGFFGNVSHLKKNTHQYSRISSNPMLESGILLVTESIKDNVNKSSKNSNFTEEDGILTAYEIVNLALDSTVLVVLSACETGLGEIHDGEGIFGLQRAFSVAGAKTLVMSLWKVNDRATQLLMGSFYENFAKNSNQKHEALLNAQRKVREKYPHPYFWGAFVIIGE